MSDKQNFVFTLKGVDDTEPAFQSLLERAKSAGAKISQNMNHGMSNKPEWMENLKEQFGRESAFGGIGEMLRGGGALIGITAGAEAIKSLAEGVNTFEHDLHDADKNAADMAQDLMKSVPVLGTIEEAGAAVNEAFTHQQEYLQKARDEAESLDKELEIHKALIKEGAQYYREIEDSLNRIKAKTAEIGMPAFQKEQAETTASGDEQKKSFTDKAAVEIQNLKDKAGPAIEELRKKIRAEQERIAQGFMVDDGDGNEIEDTQAKQDSLTHLAQLEGSKSRLERNRDNQIHGVQSETDKATSGVDDETKKQLKQQQMEHERDMREDARAAAIEHESDLQAHAADELKLQGKFLDANIAQIHAAADKEIAEQRLAADKKEHDLVKGSTEWLAIEAAVAQKSADIQQQARDKEAEARKADMQWELDEARKHAEEIAGEQFDMREKILKATGRTYLADKEQLEKQHTERLNKIKDDAAAEIRAHGEHRTEIEQRARESTDQENKSFGADSLMQQMDAVKSMAPIDMNASAVGGVGLDASAMTGLISPMAAKEMSEGAHGKQVKEIQDRLTSMMPDQAGQSSSSKDTASAGIITAIEKLISEVQHLTVNFTP